MTSSDELNPCFPIDGQRCPEYDACFGDCGDQGCPRPDRLCKVIDRGTTAMGDPFVVTRTDEHVDKIFSDPPRMPAFFWDALDLYDDERIGLEYGDHHILAPRLDHDQ